MANIHDITRDASMLRGPLARKGYDWWWHSLTAENAETGEKKPFYIEFFTCNPARAQEKPVIVHRLLVQGGVDEDVAKALESKDETQAALIAALRARIERTVSG
jgi:hypothetical protein